MNELEYEQYLNEIERLYSETAGLGDTGRLERLYDEDGFSVPGCYRTLPVPTEE